MTTSSRLRLSSELIVQTAAEIIDQEGLDRVTMRRLGMALNVDPMAIYRHIPNKEALVDLIADSVWLNLDMRPRSADTSWREYAVTIMRRLRETLRNHPNVIPIIATHPIRSPSALAVADEMIGVLITSGAPIHAQLGELVNCLVIFTVASALGEFSTPTGGTAEPAQEDPASTLSTLPNLGRLITAGWAFDLTGQFERGMHAIISGWNLT